MTNMILKTADPMTPLTPMSSLAKKTPMTTVANSGAELPAAINVAPATSGLTLSSTKQIMYFFFKTITLFVFLYLYATWKCLSSGLP